MIRYLVNRKIHIQVSRVAKHRCHPGATEALLGRRNDEKTAVVMPQQSVACSNEIAQ